MFEDRLKGIENGQILRAKGILNIEGKQIHFDYTPFVYEVREVDIKKNQKTKVAIIGCDLNDEEIKALFFKKNAKGRRDSAVGEIKDFNCTYDNSVGINGKVTEGLDLSFPDAYLHWDSMASFLKR